MNTELKTLQALEVHLQMTLDQTRKRIKMLHEESAGVSTPAARKGRGASVADRERALARRERHYNQK